MSKHIALFGGSFDPPHLGHQALVEAALAQLQLDELWVIPVGLPVHRQLSGKSSAKQRYHWLKTMFSGHPKVKIMDWEVNQSDPTPTIATLQRFQLENPSLIPTWLIGMDSFHDLPNWIAYPDHAQYCNIAVFSRKGIKNHINNTLWQPTKNNTMPSAAGHITMLDVDLPHISATQIRTNPSQYQHQLPKSTCNAILACYASPLKYTNASSNKRDTHMTDATLANDFLDQLSTEIITAIEDKKGQDIITLDVTGRCSFADRFILANGRTDRQLKALANAVRQVGHSHELTARVDGMDGMEWLVVDLGDVIVHLFLPEVRETFQLERLWSKPEEEV